MLKRVIVLLLTFTMIVSVTAFAEAETYDLSIEMQLGQREAYVNGDPIQIDENENVVPFAENGRTLVPIRFVAGALGLEVLWEQENESVILANSDIEIAFELGGNRADVNGNPYVLDCSPVVKHERTFVPVRFISEVLECDVSWENDTQKVLIKREKEQEIDVNDAEVQALFQDILNQKEFASYYGGYCDNALWDNAENIFGGTMRELFSLLRFKSFEEKEYTDSEAEAIILDFLSKGDITQSLSAYGIDNLKLQLEQGAVFGSDSTEDALVGAYDGTVLDEISVDLFGAPLPKHPNLAFLIGYHAFHLYNRVNLYYPYSKINMYIAYYNEASHQYLFMKHADLMMKNSNEDDESLQAETKLLKATKHNGKISLYIQHVSEFDEYSGGLATYGGVYKNTYQKGDDGYYWVSSLGRDTVQ